MSKRVLVLDDEAYRLQWFVGRFGAGPHLHLCSHVPQAIASLETEDYDLIFLDHDLGTEPAVGRDVARWLCAHPDVNPSAAVVVHSVNLVSAQKMYQELSAAGRLVSVMPMPVLMNIYG